MIKYLYLFVGILISCNSAFAQTPSLCKVEDTIHVQGGVNLDWYSVSVHCFGYEDQSTCDANSACVWLEQICVPNSVESINDKFPIDTNFCDQINDSVDCERLDPYGCLWQNGTCVQEVGLLQIPLGNSSKITLPTHAADGKFIVSNNGTDLYPFTVSELSVCPSTCNSFSEIDTILCTEFEVPSGNVTHSTSGTYYDTIPNSQNCDSIITINLTIAPGLNENISNSVVCGSGESNIDVTPSRSGYDYVLLNQNNDVVDGPTSGNGTSVTLTTNTISSTANYFIQAESANNTALAFDGINDQVSVSGINLDTSFTIELWAQRTSSNSNDILVKYGGTINDDGLHVGYLSNGDLRFGFYFNDINYSAGSIATDGLWHHYAFVYDDDQLQKHIYIDGVLVHSGASNDFIGRNHDLQIGVSFGNSDHWAGNMDELKVWGKVRSQAEIDSSVSECLSGDETNLLGYFDFNEGQDASTLYNITSGQNGQLQNFDVNNAWITSTISGGCSGFCSIAVEVEVLSIDTSMTVSLPDLTSNEVGATYQWIDCNNAGTSINGETNQTYTAQSTGSYAVEVTKNGCIDTSECRNIVITSVIENSLSEAFEVFPNPTTGQVNVSFKSPQTMQVILKTVTSQTIQSINMIKESSAELLINEKPGIYFLELINEQNQRSVIRIVKQ